MKKERGDGFVGLCFFLISIFTSIAITMAIFFGLKTDAQIQLFIMSIFMSLFGLFYFGIDYFKPDLFNKGD